MTNREVRKAIYKKKQKSWISKILVFLRVYSVEYAGTVTKKAYEPNTLRLYRERVNRFNPLSYISILVTVVIVILVSLLKAICFFVNEILEQLMLEFNGFKASFNWHEWTLDDFKINWKD